MNFARRGWPFVRMMRPIALAALTSQQGPLERQKHWRAPDCRPWLEQYLNANIGTEIHLAFRFEIDGE